MDKIYLKIAQELEKNNEDIAKVLKKFQIQTAKELLILQKITAIEIKEMHYSMDEEEDTFHSTAVELLKKQQDTDAELFEAHYTK